MSQSGERFLQGKHKVLFRFYKSGKQLENLSQLAKRWGYSEGGGGFNRYVKELMDEKRLKRKKKGDAVYLTISFKGEISILPFIMPKLLLLFILLVSLSIITLALPGVMVHIPESPYALMALGVIVLCFSVFSLLLLDRLEWKLLATE